MWVALAFLFVTSSTTPATTVVGQYPNQFVKEAECRAFLTEKLKEEQSDVVFIETRLGVHQARVIQREFKCVRNEEGQGI